MIHRTGIALLTGIYSGHFWDWTRSDRKKGRAKITWRIAWHWWKFGRWLIHWASEWMSELFCCLFVWLFGRKLGLHNILHQTLQNGQCIDKIIRDIFSFLLLSIRIDVFGGRGFCLRHFLYYMISHFRNITIWYLTACCLRTGTIWYPTACCLRTGTTLRLCALHSHEICCKFFFQI